jgi:apolipoprotein D and lipocalin family protein
MKPLIATAGIIFVLFGGAANVAGDSPLKVVDTVDLNRYLGKWYEIASNPAWFQKGCTGSTAEYSLRPDGKIQVINRCFKDSLDGPLKESKGKAEVVDTTTNAKLKVWFFWPFKGDYWIIDLGSDYQWAVVGEPARKYLWILSRTPTMDESLYREIVRRSQQQGYDPERLQRTAQKRN